MTGVARSEYPAYLFDLDGTLVDSAPDITAALNRQLGRFCDLPPLTVALVTAWVGTGSERLIRTALAHHGAAADEATVARLLSAYATDYAARAVELSMPYPHAFSTLRELHLRGARLAIVTNKLAAVTRNVLRHFAIDELFTVVIGGDDVPRGKPDPLPLLTACLRLHIVPQAGVMVGDSANDVRAARAAGMPAIAVNYGYNHGEPIDNAQPDRIVASLAELL